MAKSLISLSNVALKNFLTLPKYVGATRLCHSISQIKETHNEAKTEITASKQLFELLNKDNDPLSLISNIEANKNKIDGRHVVLALTSMQKFYQANGIPPSDVHKSTHFIKICSVLNRHLVTLELPQVIQALKILNLLNVSSSLMIMQSLLQLIRHSINDLSLQQIFYLSFLLKQMKLTHLSEAIITALPEVFVAQLELQLDKEDIKELKNALWFASYHTRNAETIQYILDALDNNEQAMDVDSAISIFLSLCNITILPDNYINVFYKVKEALIENVSLLESSEIMKIILKILTKTKDGFDDFYDPSFIDTFIDKLISNNCEFDEGVLILHKLNKCKHISIPLVHYLSSVCNENPLILSNCKSVHISTLVAGLAFANYKPPSWNKLQKNIIENYTRLPDDVTLCYFALHLASLDSFDSKLLTCIFSADIKPELLSHNYCKTLQQLYQSVKTLYPAYSGPWPSEELIESFKKLQTFDETKAYPLLPLIERLVGDSAYVNTNVKTNLGHKIDHLIILQDGCPIAVKSNSTCKDLHSISYVENLIIPPNTQRVAVLFIPSEVYGKNIPILRAPVMLNIKSLEAMSYKVVHISRDMWMTIPDCERLPYLQYLIGLSKDIDNNNQHINR